jgi:hypothetical protein
MNIYLLISDTLCIGSIIEPIGTNDFKPVIGKWNMTTGEIIPMKYEHPDIKKKRISFGVSMENGIYVECYNYHDLITICDLNGNLKYNIYGPGWENKHARIDYYSRPVFCGDKLLVLYTGDEEDINKSQNGKSSLPSKFLVFDLNGYYIKTIDTGYRIDFSVCYDKENNRIIMGMDDDIQFGYLDLNGLI